MRFLLFKTRDKQACHEASSQWHDAASSLIPRPVCWRRDGDLVMFCDIRPKSNDFGWRLDPENCTGWIDAAAFGLKAAKKTVSTDSPRAH